MEDTNDSSGMDAPCQLISWFLLLRTPVNDSSWKTHGFFHLYQWVVECRVLEGILSPILWKMKENCLPLQSIWIIPGWFIRGWWGWRNQYPDNKRQHHKPGKLAQTQVTLLQEKNFRIACLNSAAIRGTKTDAFKTMKLMYLCALLCSWKAIKIFCFLSKSK